MRTTLLTSLSVLAVAFVSVSCDSTPVEPKEVAAESAASPSFTVQQYRDSSEWFVQFTDYVACLGESVQFSGVVPLTSLTLVGPSGRVLILTKADPATPKSPWLAEGEYSGIVWEGRAATDQRRLVFGSDAGSSTNDTYNETYISKDGPTFRATGKFHGTINANGEVTSFINDFEYQCMGQG